MGLCGCDVVVFGFCVLDRFDVGRRVRVYG